VQAVIDPGVALDAVRRSLADELESTEMSITLFYGVIDDTAGVLRFANAGHPHAFVLRRDGSCDRLDAQVPPLGFCEELVLSGEVSWSAGDRLLLFTDGVADARNAQGERFGEAAVLRAAVDAVHNGNGVATAVPHTRRDDHTDSRQPLTQAPPNVALTAVFDAVRAFVGTTPLIDDLAVVVVDRTAVPSAASPHLLEPRAAFRAVV
jgi:sigma-B regulation protein RsbU (phosphoserine phosphatase)